MKPSEILRSATLPTFDDYLEVVCWLRERIAAAEHPEPKEPGEILAWALDELEIQTDQAKSHPQEWEQRLPFAATLAYTVAALMQGGVVPEKLPWEEAADGDGEGAPATGAMERWAAEQGWNEASQLALALQYITNQQSDEAFADFLAQAAAAEGNWSASEGRVLR